jgi:replicative DNA helicase
MDSEQFTRYQKASEEFAKYPILYSLKRGLTFPQIKSKLIMMKNKLGRLDFIVIDYVQKIRTPKGHSRQRELADVSEELGVLAQEFDCPLFALSQVNDGGRTREAEDLENDADIVLKLRREVFEYRSLFIKTDKFPKLNGENMPEDYATLQITKNKNGRTGGVELRSKLEYQRFEDWDKVY